MADPLSALRAATGQSPDQTGSDLPSIPAVPLTSSPHETNFLASVKSWLEKAAGTAGFVSRRDLASYGVIQANSDGTFGPVVPPNKTVPPAPTNLQATGAMTNIILDWDDPNAAYGNHAYTEVWASETISFSTAVMVGQSAGFNFAHAVGAGSTRYYWIRFVSTSDVKGPYNDVGGTVANTSNDPAWLLSVLNNQITEDQLYTTLNTRIDLIDAASSVAGSVNARVQAVQDVVNDFLIAPDWLIGTTYAIGDMVVYSGKLYRALRTTVGDQPNTSALDWQLIGDYTSLGATVAGHTTDIATLVTDLGAEVTARTVLAAGGATKRSIFRQGSAPSSVGLIAGDLWIDTSSNYATDFFASDYASIRHKMYQWSGTDWVDSTDDQIYDNAAAIVTEQSVRADADNAIAVDLTALTSRVGTAESSLVTEQTTRASADTALASRATALEATVNSGTDCNTALKARIASEETARASADTALASRATALEATVNSGTDGNTALKARIVSEETARASGDSANASSITAVQARLDSGGDISNAIVLSQTTASTGVTNAATAQTTANSKVKTFFQTSSPTASTTGDLWVDTDDNNHIYRWSGSAWSDAHDARITSTASQVTTIQTTVDGHTTSIATNATSIDGVKAQYTVKIDNNGVMSGYGLSSDLIAGTGVLSKFIASVDQFAVVAPNRTAGQLNSVPFAVLRTSQTINGVSFAPGVYIDGASINTGTIGNTQIANAAIDTAKIADASIVTAKIGDAQITDAKISGVIQSTGYAPGNTGWQIDKDGSVEFGSGVFRGNIYAEAGFFSGVVSAASVQAALSNSTNYTYGTPGTYSLTIPTGLDADSIRVRIIGGSGGGGGGGGGTRAAYSAGQIAEAQAGMSANRAKMEALYKRYAEDIASREADIAANYGTAATNLGGIYDTATGNISKAYDAARAAQNQQLLNLGMTEQTPVQTFGNQTAATTGLENLRAAVLAQNEASRKAAITNQRLASEGATREGVQKLSAYDAEVARAIAEMQSATVSSGGGGGSSSGLSPNQYASLALQKMKMDQDAQIAAANLAAKTAPKATVDKQALLNQVAGSPGLTSDQYNMFRALNG